MKKKQKTIYYRRKREGKTNYKKRLRLLLAKKPRLVFRMTNTKIIAQLIDFKNTGDLVLIGLDSTALSKLGWKGSLKNTSAAYLTGYLLGKKAKDKNISEVVFDSGFKSPKKGSKIYGFLKGVLEGGLNFNHSKEIFPSEERINGKHIQEYAKKTEKEKIFSKYLKNKLDPEKITEHFQEIKAKIK